MLAVAVRGFHYEKIGVFVGIRPGTHDLAGRGSIHRDASHISGEQRFPRASVLGQEDLNHRRAEDVTGVYKAKRKLCPQFHRFPKGNGPKQMQAVFGLLERVERQGRLVLGGAFLVVKSSFFFLKMAGIGKDHGTQVDGRLRGVDRALETSFDQPGNPATVVEMGVGQNHGVDLSRRYWSIFPVADAPLFPTLKQTTVNENLQSLLAVKIAGGVDEMLRARHRPRGAQKLKVSQSV